MLSDVSAAHVSCGRQRMLREQAVGLAQLGHRVQIVARAPVDDPRPHVRIGEVDEWRFDGGRDHEMGSLMAQLHRSVDVFDRATRRGRPDIVLIHQPTAGLGPILRRRSAVPTWAYMCHVLAQDDYDLRCDAEQDEMAAWRRSANSQGRYWAERLMLSHCSQVIVLSDFMRERVAQVHRIPSGLLWRIPGAADAERFHPASDRSLVRRELGWSQERTILFVLRRLVPRMGLDLLIDAVRLLGEDGRDVMLYIGGEGPLLETLQAQIDRAGLAAQVRFVGYVPEERLCAHYQAADLVVVPTPALEGFGLVTVEALASRTPVLATPVGALPEVLRRVDPALVAESADAPGLADSLRRLLRRFAEEPGEQERLARKGRVLVERELNWSHHIVNLESVLLADSHRLRRAA